MVTVRVDAGSGDGINALLWPHRPWIGRDDGLSEVDNWLTPCLRRLPAA
jgi:hypothetical protein